MRSGRESGFTLIELLVVVAVIGILVAAVLPVLPPALHKAKFARAAVELREVAEAWNERLNVLQLGRSDLFPTGRTLDPDAVFPELVTAQELEDFLAIPVPEFDPWGRRYEYRVEAFPSSCLFARTGNADGVLSPEIVVGTQVSPEDRVTDLAIIETRWVNGPAPTRAETVVPPIRIDPVAFPRFLPPPTP